MPLISSSVEVPDILEIQPEVDSELKRQLQHLVDEEAQVLVHCTYEADDWGGGIRIWHSTFLVDQNSGHRSRLLHAENITFMPVWTFLRPYERIHFLLVFERLPKGCVLFDLIEEIPESGGFEVRDIRRNKSDVYRVRLL